MATPWKYSGPSRCLETSRPLGRLRPSALHAVYPTMCFNTHLRVPLTPNACDTHPPRDETAPPFPHCTPGGPLITVGVACSGKAHPLRLYPGRQRLYVHRDFARVATCHHQSYRRTRRSIARDRWRGNRKLEVLFRIPPTLRTAVGCCCTTTASACAAASAAALAASA